MQLHGSTEVIALAYCWLIDCDIQLHQEPHPTSCCCTNRVWNGYTDGCFVAFISWPARTGGAAIVSLLLSVPLRHTQISPKLARAMVTIILEYKIGGSDSGCAIRFGPVTRCRAYNSPFCRPTHCVGAALAMETWLSVSVSVTLMYCTQMTESIILRPSPDRSPAILVFSYPIWTR